MPEVEPDGGGRLALGQSLRRRTGGPSFPSGGVDLMEDVEMEDANPLPALPEDLDDAEMDEPPVQQQAPRESSASPISLPPAAHHVIIMNRSTDFLFEADGEAGVNSV